MAPKSFGTVTILVLVLLLFLSYSAKSSSSDASADDRNKISLTLANSSFAPLTTVHGNQVVVSVRYQVNDESLEGERVNGIMKIYYSNGSLIHSSSFPDGFIAKKKGGTEDFKTTIRDPTIQSITANVTFTDLKKTETISNVITTNLQLQTHSTSSASIDSENKG
jgi:hypothetical protein